MKKTLLLLLLLVSFTYSSEAQTKRIAMRSYSCMAKPIPDSPDNLGMMYERPTHIETREFKPVIVDTVIPVPAPVDSVINLKKIYNAKKMKPAQQAGDVDSLPDTSQPSAPVAPYIRKTGAPVKNYNSAIQAKNNESRLAGGIMIFLALSAAISLFISFKK
jgi:hypothetical protein